MTAVRHQIAFEMPEEHSLVGVIVVARTASGSVVASGQPVAGQTMPPNLPNVLRWLADAYDIEHLEVLE